MFEEHEEPNHHIEKMETEGKSQHFLFVSELICRTLSVAGVLCLIMAKCGQVCIVCTLSVQAININGPRCWWM
jgi:hypothetical protein